MDDATQDLVEWLRHRVATETGTDPEAIDPTVPLYRYGVDSRTLAFIVDNAEAEFSLAADLDRISPAEPLDVLVTAFAPDPEARRA